MKKIIIFIVMINLNCTQNKEKNSHFLKNFKINKEYKGKGNIINNKHDINKLEFSNEENIPIKYDNKLFFGYKKKLEDNYYLISYIKIYKSKVKTPLIFDLVFEEYTCIYDSLNDKINSKLKTFSDGPFLKIQTNLKNNKYQINYKYLNSNNKYDTLNETYIIDKYRFVSTP